MMQHKNDGWKAAGCSKTGMNAQTGNGRQTRGRHEAQHKTKEAKETKRLEEE